MHTERFSEESKERRVAGNAVGEMNTCTDVHGDLAWICVASHLILSISIYDKISSLKEGAKRNIGAAELAVRGTGTNASSLGYCDGSYRPVDSNQ